MPPGRPIPDGGEWLADWLSGFRTRLYNTFEAAGSVNAAAPSSGGVGNAFSGEKQKAANRNTKTSLTPARPGEARLLIPYLPFRRSSQPTWADAQTSPAYM